MLNRHELLLEQNLDRRDRKPTFKVVSQNLTGKIEKNYENPQGS